ncbi:MAG TPA: hypothetical protein ENN21_06690, partial [Spirochaetes bacterium]|nr:hypothetical protein [Spirochaetota bacterium]
MKKLLICAAAFIIGCGGTQKSPDAVRKTLTVMTINVWSGLDYKGTLKMGEYENEERRNKRYRALLAEIAEKSPDIIGINEANFLPGYARTLAADAGYDVIYHVGVAGLKVFRVGLPWNLKEGDCILAKKDLGLQWVGRKQLSGGGFIWNNLSFHTADATQVVVGRIRVNGVDIYAAVTHWHASPANTIEMKKKLNELKKKWGYTDSQLDDAERKLIEDQQWRMEEARLMAAYLREVVPAGAKLVVMGDFNAVVESPEVKLFLDSGYWDAYRGPRGYTWDPVNENIKKYY